MFGKNPFVVSLSGVSSVFLVAHSASLASPRVMSHCLDVSIVFSVLLQALIVFSVLLQALIVLGVVVDSFTLFKCL